MRAAVIPNIDTHIAVKTAREVCEKLSSLGVEHTLPEQLRGLVGADALYTDDAAAVASSDVVIAVGGDGCMIRCAKKAAAAGKPVLGINAGHLAFMSGLESDELDGLANLVRGDYTLTSRMLLSVRCSKGSDTVFSDICVNDVLIGRGRDVQMAYMTVNASGTIIGYRADGLIFATPTGSTAYSLSAGGPVLEPTLRAIVMTPVCPHSLFSRSVIFAPDDRIEVRAADAEKKQNLIFSCDGGRALELPEGATLTVGAADITADIITIKSEGFMKVLSGKMEGR